MFDFLPAVAVNEEPGLGFGLSLRGGHGVGTSPVVLLSVFLQGVKFVLHIWVTEVFNGVTLYDNIKLISVCHNIAFRTMTSINMFNIFCVCVFLFIYIYILCLRATLNSI